MVYAKPKIRRINSPGTSIVVVVCRERKDMSAAAAVTAFVCMLAEAVQRGNSGLGVDPSAVARPGIYPHARSRLPADISNNNRR